MNDAMPNETHRPFSLLAVLSYALMVAITVVGFLVIRSYGEPLEAPMRAGQELAAAPGPAPEIFLRVLIALTAIIVLGQVLGRLFVYLRQPPVIGEVVAGILLGPSLLGPALSEKILPSGVAPFLSVIAQLGVVLYMFIVGLELNPAMLKNRAHAMVATSHASILTPFLLGALLALPLYTLLGSADVPFTNFALFLGVAMSITAFPVLARILSDYKLTRTGLGVAAISCAAVDDVTAWCLLALVVGVTTAQVSDAVVVAGGAMAFVTFVLLVARPLLIRLTQRWENVPQSRSLFTMIFVALLLSALTAEAIGIHAIFGAFLLGAVIPHDSAAAKALTRQLQHVVSIVLLPAFFAFTGMRTRIDLLSEPSHWLICGLIIVVATAGKFGGTLIAARLTGMGWRSAAMLGTLMNTRGLMELIVLNVGLDLKIISPTLFSMMVVMALVTTALTSPVLWLLRPKSAGASESGELAQKVSLARHEAARFAVADPLCRNHEHPLSDRWK